MATKQGKLAFAFLTAYLAKHRKATFAEASEAAKQHGHKIWPISYGRAQVVTGIVKAAKRGTGRFAKAKTVTEKRAAVSKASHDGRGTRTDIVSSVRALGADRDKLHRVFLTIQKIVAEALDN